MSSNEVFKLFIASEGFPNLLERLDSHGAANADGLKAPPDLTFEAQMLVHSDISSIPTNTIVTLIIQDRVVPKLESLTEPKHRQPDTDRLPKSSDRSSHNYYANRD